MIEEMVKKIKRKKNEKGKILVKKIKLFSKS